MRAISLEQSQLSWGPLVLTEEKINYLWAKLHEFPQVFDDFGRSDFNGFVAKLLNKNNIFLDIGPGIGLACGMAIRPGLDTVLHLVMFDRRLRGRELIFLDIMGHFFRVLQLRRMTVMLTADNRTAIKLVQRLGFIQEGCMRNAIKRDNQLLDVEIFGILREEFDEAYTAQSVGPVTDRNITPGTNSVSLGNATKESASI